MNYFLPFLAAILWGGNTVVTKLCATVMAPVEIGFYRWLVAALVLAPFVFTKIKADFSKLKPDLPKLALLGFLGGVVFQSLAYYAAHYTTATNMGIIQSLMPVMALVLAFFFLRHVSSIGSILGVIVSGVGVIIVVSRGDFLSMVASGVNRGDLLMLVATFSFALYGFLIHKWGLAVPLIQSVFIQAIVALVMLFPFYIAAPKSAIVLHSAFYVGFAGVGASVIAPLVWMHGIAKIGAARASLFFNFVPIVTAILAALLLSEKMTTSVMVGGGLALLGVVMAEVLRSRT